MSMSHPVRGASARIYAVLLAVSMSLAPAVHAAIIFSGGGGTPFTVTLDAPIVFTSSANFSPGASNYGVLISGVYTGNAVGAFAQKTGDIGLVGSQTGMWDEGGGAMGMPFGAAGLNDLVIFINGINPGSNTWSTNDTLTVTAGMLTTDVNFAPPLPDASGPFTVQIVYGNNGAVVAEFGSQSVGVVPEPGASVLVLFAGGCLLLRRRRRR